MCERLLVSTLGLFMRVYYYCIGHSLRNSGAFIDRDSRSGGPDSLAAKIHYHGNATARKVRRRRADVTRLPPSHATVGRDTRDFALTASESQ